MRELINNNSEGLVLVLFKKKIHHKIGILAEAAASVWQTGRVRLFNCLRPRPDSARYCGVIYTGREWRMAAALSGTGQ